MVIPVYNIEAHLRQCLDSVAGQTLSDLEVICVDDGSTDASPAILEEYAQKDPRFQVIRQANAGPGAARNRGMERSSGRYLIFLLAKEQGIAAQKDILKAGGTDAGAIHQTRAGVYTGGISIPTRYIHTPQEMADHLFQFTYGWPWDKLYRRDYILKEKFRYPALPNSEDLVFVFPSVFCAGRIAVLDRVLVHHRVNRLSSVSNSRSKTPEASYQALKLVEACLEERGLMEIYRQSFLNWAMEFLVWHVCSIGDRAVQRRYFRVLRQGLLGLLHGFLMDVDEGLGIGVHSGLEVFPGRAFQSVQLRDLDHGVDAVLAILVGAEGEQLGNGTQNRHLLHSLGGGGAGVGQDGDHPQGGRRCPQAPV